MLGECEHTSAGLYGRPARAGRAIVPTESAHGWLDGHTPVLIRIARNTDALRSVGTLHAAYMALAMLSECEHVRFGLWVHWERQRWARTGHMNDRESLGSGMGRDQTDETTR